MHILGLADGLTISISCVFFLSFDVLIIFVLYIGYVDAS